MRSTELHANIHCRKYISSFKKKCLSNIGLIYTEKTLFGAAKFRYWVKWWYKRKFYHVYISLQALNNLQSTFQGFGHVNSENVFKVSDLYIEGSL